MLEGGHPLSNPQLLSDVQEDRILFLQIHKHAGRGQLPYHDLFRFSSLLPKESRHRIRIDGISELAFARRDREFLVVLSLVQHDQHL